MSVSTTRSLSTTAGRDLKYLLELDGKLTFKFLHGTNAQLEGVEAGTGRKMTVQINRRLEDEEFKQIKIVSSGELWSLAESSS